MCLPSPSGIKGKGEMVSEVPLETSLEQMNH